MKDRRSSARLHVDAHLDDLQSELEAGSRTLDKIETEVVRLDRLRTELRDPGSIGTLLRQVTELMGSLRSQQATLRELRVEMPKLRMQVARARRAGDIPPRADDPIRP